MRIELADLDCPQVLHLLRIHLAGMHANSPPGAVSALDLSGLRRPDVTLYAAWNADTLVGLGALKELSPDRGEIKSMRTHPDHLRQGVAQDLLEHLIEESCRRQYRWLCLETGSGPAFEPALRLYLTNGFVTGPAFADYVKSDFNQFLHKEL
jgi:putative acetyltransferase